jgi:hypothetical protein
MIDCARTPPPAGELRALLAQLDDRGLQLLLHSGGSAGTLDEVVTAFAERSSLLPAPVVVCGSRSTLADAPERALLLLA